MMLPSAVVSPPTNSNPTTTCIKRTKRTTQLLKAKLLGRKTGKGFYTYGGKKDKGPKQLNPEAQVTFEEVDCHCDALIWGFAFFWGGG